MPIPEDLEKCPYCGSEWREVDLDTNTARWECGSKRVPFQPPIQSDKCDEIVTLQGAEARETVSKLRTLLKPEELRSIPRPLRIDIMGLLWPERANEDGDEDEYA